MATQLIKVKGVAVGADNKPVEVEDLIPAPPPAPEPVIVNIADFAKLINYAKRQGWI
jgi:hypothetical protein